MGDKADNTSLIDEYQGRHADQMVCPHQIAAFIHKAGQFHLAALEIILHHLRTLPHIHQDDLNAFLFNGGKVIINGT